MPRRLCTRTLASAWRKITALLLVGLILYIIALAITATAVSAELKEVKALRMNGARNVVEVVFVVKIVNNGLTDIDIEKLYYEVYINGKYLGEGSKENLVIHRGVNEIELSLETTPSDAVTALISAALARNENVDVTVKGKILLPLKSFGFIRLWTVEIPFEKTETVKIELATIPGK